ncbi:MAG: thioredoxin family protein [Hyphomicrobiaceae bacterium]|nr:thioredoxin family protein [Hyphomicrobiaceae bacterium]
MKRLLVVLAFCLFATAAHATKLGEDGLHKEPWFAVTFRDLREDLAAAKAAGKRLAIIIEQRGCTYCKRLHETVLSDPEVVKYIKANFMMVQYNMFGDEEVVDLDGKKLTEKTAVRRWGLAFTPTVIFFPEDAPDKTKNAREVAVNVMPGAFGKWTVLDMFTWVREKGYTKDEPFQKYHARRINERRAARKK